MDFDQKCSICPSSSDVILSLPCGHDICVSCAAQKTQENLSSKEPKSLFCEGCSENFILEENQLSMIEAFLLANSIRILDQTDNSTTPQNISRDKSRIDRLFERLTNKLNGRVWSKQHKLIEMSDGIDTQGCAARTIYDWGFI